MHDDLSDALDRLLSPLADGRFEPNADVYVDDADRVVVLVEVAGADAESVQIAVDDRYLYVLGRRDVDLRATSILRKEIPHGEFFKRLRLPVPVDEARSSASYRDGIVRIELPIVAPNHTKTERTEIRVTVKRIIA